MTPGPTKKRPNNALRALRLLVVVAGGAGGWFGYEEFTARQDVAAAAAAESDEAGSEVAPWPANLVVADTAWSGPTVMTLQPQGDVVRQQIEFDPESGRVNMLLFSPTGDTSAEVELSGSETYFDQRDGAGWTQPRPDAAISSASLRGSAYQFAAPTLVELIPVKVWPYTDLVAEGPGPSASTPTRMLTFRIKAAAFATAEPALAAQWRNHSVLPSEIDVVEFSVELDQEGHVLSFTDGSATAPLLFRIAPLDEAPTFESPLAG